MRLARSRCNTRSKVILFGPQKDAEDAIKKKSPYGMGLNCSVLFTLGTLSVSGGTPEPS